MKLEAIEPELRLAWRLVPGRNVKGKSQEEVFLATDINLPGAVDWVVMQSCFGFLFMLVLEKCGDHQQFFALVQLIGTRKQAENFAYQLELNRDQHRLTWEDESWT